MKSKPADEGKTTLAEFERTMKALFKVPKAEVQDAKPAKTRKRKLPK
jgi:hypothetical protein